MSLNRCELGEQTTTEANRVQLARDFYWLCSDPATLEKAKWFDHRLQDAWILCDYSVNEYIALLKGYLANQKSYSFDYQDNLIYVVLVAKTLLDDVFIHQLLNEDEYFEAIDATVILYREQLEEAMSGLQDAHGKDAVAYAKYQASFALAESYIKVGIKKARAQSSRVDLTYPDIKRGMMDYKNNLELLCSLDQHFLTENNAHCETPRVLKFVEYLSLYLPEQATMADDDIQDFIKVIKDALNVCAAMPWNCVEPLDAIRLAKLSVARLYVNTPASKENNKSNAVQALYWFEEAKKSGAELSEEDENFINENTTALEAVIDSTFHHLQFLVDYQRNQPEISAAKKTIFSDLLNILQQDNTSNLNRIMRFKDALETADRTILLSHDKPTWRRFVENALSFIALLIPAIIRAYKSNTMYGTCRFWQPESKRALKAAENTINSLIYKKVAAKF